MIEEVICGSPDHPPPFVDQPLGAANIPSEPAHLTVEVALVFVGKQELRPQQVRQGQEAPVSVEDLMID
jgi:hypothetical protein